LKNEENRGVGEISISGICFADIQFVIEDNAMRE
jgi:hypothetical protein